MQALKAKKKALLDRLKLNPQDSVAKKQLDEVENEIFSGAEEAQFYDPTQGSAPIPRGTPSAKEGAVEYPQGTELNKTIPPKIATPTPPSAVTDIPADVKQDAAVVDSGKVPQVNTNNMEKPKINEVDLNPPQGDGDKIPEPPAKIDETKPTTADKQQANSDFLNRQVKTGTADVPDIPAQLANKEEPPLNLEGLEPPVQTDVIPPKEGQPEEGQTGEPIAEEEGTANTTIPPPSLPEVDDPNLNQSRSTTITSEESPFQVPMAEATTDAVGFEEEKGMDADRARASLGGLLELDSKQKEIIAEREAKGKEQYDLMKSEFDRIEMRDFVDGIVQSFGTMLAGVVGLASDLPVGQYYKAMDVFDPTKSMEATKALYEAGMASLDETQKEKMAQLKGVFDAMWSDAPYKTRIEYLKQMHDITKSQVNASSSADNQADRVSASTSTSEANKQALTQAKEASDRAKALREDKTYVANRERLGKLTEIMDTGSASGLLDVNATERQMKWNEQLAKSGITKKLNQPLKTILGEGVMEETGGFAGIGARPSVWSTLNTEIKPGYLDKKTGKMVDTGFSGQEAALTRCAEAISASLAGYRNDMVTVPDKEQIMEGMKMIRDVQHSNGLPITGQSLVNDTLAVLKAGYNGGKAVNRVSDNELVVAEIADSYFGVPLKANGFFTYYTVAAAKASLERQVGEHQSQIYEADEQARNLQYSAISGGARRGGRVYPPLTDGISPNEVEPQPGRNGRGEWYGIYADEIPKAKVLPDGDIQLPPAWNDPKVISTVDAITSKYGMKPQELMALIALESAETFDPRALELGGTGATGLIQFVPTTAIGLAQIHKVPGSERWDKNDTASRQEAQKWVAGLPLVNQLELVDTYLSDSLRANGAKDAKGIYTAIFRGSNTNTGPITVATPGNAYDKNRPLDTNNDGRISYDEWTARVTPYVEKYSKMKWGAKTQPLADSAGAQ